MRLITLTPTVTLAEKLVFPEWRKQSANRTAPLPNIEHAATDRESLLAPRPPSKNALIGAASVGSALARCCARRGHNLLLGRCDQNDLGLRYQCRTKKPKFWRLLRLGRMSRPSIKVVLVMCTCRGSIERARIDF